MILQITWVCVAPLLNSLCFHMWWDMSLKAFVLQPSHFNLILAFIISLRWHKYQTFERLMQKSHIQSSSESADTRQTLDWRSEWPWTSINYVKLVVARHQKRGRPLLRPMRARERNTCCGAVTPPHLKPEVWELSFAWLSYRKSLSSLRAGPGAPWRAGNKQF